METKHSKLIFIRAITIFMLVIAIFSCSFTTAYAAEPIKTNLTLNDLQSKCWHLGSKSINIKQLYEYIHSNFNIDIPSINANNPNNPVVAVIDSGLAKNHPFFENSLWVNPVEQTGKPNFDDDGNGVEDDINGANFADGFATGDYSDCMVGGSSGKDWHGTHVAGIVHSVCPNAKIMPIRAGKMGSEGATFDENDVIDAILFAANNGADIINMSFGTDSIKFVQTKKEVNLNGVATSVSIQDAINYAVVEKNCMVVCAAGNKGTTKPFYPASCNNVVSVMGSNKDKKLYYGSNYGNYDVLAPGEGILSSIGPNVTATGTGVKESGKVFTGDIIGFADKNGTSMASPLVAGVGALLMTATNTDKASDITPYITSNKLLTFAKTDKMEDKNVLLDYDAIVRMLNNIEAGAIIDDNDVYVANKEFNYNEEVSISAKREYEGEYKWYLNSKYVASGRNYTFTPKENAVLELRVNDVIKERYYIKSNLYTKNIEVYDNETVKLQPHGEYKGELTWYINGKKVASGLSYTFMPKKDAEVELRENDFIVEKYIVKVKSFDKFVGVVVGSTVGAVLAVVVISVTIYLVYKKKMLNKTIKNEQKNEQNNE